MFVILHHSCIRLPKFGDKNNRTLSATSLYSSRPTKVNFNPKNRLFLSSDVETGDIADIRLNSLVSLHRLAVDISQISREISGFEV